jgi:hypothetical protein
MTKNQRQKLFETVFLNKTIVAVEASSINVVHFTFSDSTTVSIDAEEFHFGIPAINANNNWPAPEAWKSASSAIDAVKNEAWK